MNTFSDSEKVDIFEYDVPEKEVPVEKSTDDIENFHEDDTVIEKERTRRRRRHRGPKKKGKAPSYNWAFFLASLFTGIGFTATFEHPMGIFLGLGIGFLFFVDPIYQKVMSIIDRI